MADEYEPILTDAEDLQAAIATALGAASVCWESMEGTGVFDSDRCLNIMNELNEWIVSKYGYLAERMEELLVAFNKLADAVGVPREGVIAEVRTDAMGHQLPRLGEQVAKQVGKTLPF